MRLTVLRDADRRALTVRADDDVRSAMQTMNETGRTLLVVADAADRLEGVVADGDIRRFIARGGASEHPVAAALNPNPTTLPGATPPGEIRAFMARRGLEYLPLVDDRGIVALCILDRAPRSTDLTAVVMAGGLGSRLSPLTDNCPKPLLQIGGKPILSHIVEHLREQGIHRFVFAVNYLAQMIVDHYDDGSDWDCFIDYVHETQRLGTGGPLSLLDLDSVSDPFLCLNGDVLTDVDVGAVLDAHRSNDWDATMVVRGYSHTVPYGVVDTDRGGAFVAIREKPVENYLINAGMYVLSKSVVPLVPPDRAYDLPDLFGELEAHGLRSGTYTHEGRWIDIGTRPEYDRAVAIFSDGAPR